MVSTTHVVLVLREPRVQGVWDVGQQVVIETYEKDHLGGKAGQKQYLRGTERNGVWGDNGIREDLPRGGNVLDEAWRMDVTANLPQPALIAV